MRRGYYQDIKQRTTAGGRNPDHVTIMPGITPIIADTDEQAQAIDRDRNGELDLNNTLVQLGRPFNYHDLSQYELDEAFPDMGELGSDGYRGHAEHIKHVARGQGLTLRQAAWRVAAPISSFVGSPKTVADEIERWFVDGPVDGFNVHFRSPSEFVRFTDEVLPLLCERGLFRSEYSHNTLRGHLGLPVPINRHSAARAVQASASSESLQTAASSQVMRCSFPIQTTRQYQGVIMSATC